MKVIFWVSSMLIIYTMVGYPIVLELMNKICKHKKINVNKQFTPLVSIIVPAHNEESVIENKIKNLLSVEYNENKLEIIITSDNSTDKTNLIVQDYVNKFPGRVILHQVKQRKGKTNAQDEAVRISTGNIIVFTDANSMFEKSAISELVSCLSDDMVGYVTGQLVYTNANKNLTSSSEGMYWDIDLQMRQIESDLASITAGNGSIYAVRKSEYMEINPIYSHDSIFPPKFVISGTRAVYNKHAIAYEKAGENDQDEFERKVRMSRKIIAINFKDMKKYNIFRYGMFSFFYFSHRTLRNNLYFLHLLVLITNLGLLFGTNSIFYYVTFLSQIIIYILFFSKVTLSNRYLKFIIYYVMTVYAQFVGAVREISGKSKPFWEKAESTR